MSPTSQNHCRQRPCRSPHGAADALVVEHLHFAAKVAANYARRTGHPKEDLEQLAAIGLIKASRRYDCKRVNRSSSNFIAYAMELPRFRGQVVRSHAMTLRLSIDDYSDQIKTPVHGAAKARGC